jgi:sarcosine oxidase subunit alpha
VLGGSLTYARFDIEGTRAASLRRNCWQPWRATQYPGAAGRHLQRLVHRQLPAGDPAQAPVQGARQPLPGGGGSFDQPVVFRNNDLPGVMLTSAASG